MKKRSEEYWFNRADQRLVTSELIGSDAINNILPVYEQALKNVKTSIKSIYSNYAKNGVLDVKDLQSALNPLEKRKFIRAITEKALVLGIDPKKLLDTRYLSRLTRLEALKTQLEYTIRSIAPIEDQISTQAYDDILQNSYKLAQRDLKRQGIEPAFSILDQSVVDSILKQKFFGENYSSRIYANVEQLAKELPVIMGGALSTGTSYQKTAKLISQRFDVSRYNATRLVRTETNYFHNQSELQSYEDDGIKKYKYSAHLDGRTSKICRRLNGKVFLVKNGNPGKNYPPMHPNCRSTTIAVF